MGWDPDVVPDPQDPETFERSKLDWSELTRAGTPRMLDVYRRLAALRRELPELTDPSFERTRCTADEDTRLFTMRRGGSLVVVVNFGDRARGTTTVGRGSALLLRDRVGCRPRRLRADGARPRRRPARSG